MSQFDVADVKYRTCCCGLHITTLSRILISIALIVCLHFFFLAVLFVLMEWITIAQMLEQMTLSQIVSLPIIVLGVVAVFKEGRTLLLIYIILVAFQYMLFLMEFIIGTGDFIELLHPHVDKNGVMRNENYTNTTIFLVPYDGEIPDNVVPQEAIRSFCLVFFFASFAVVIPFLRTFSNLAQFIKDREEAEQNGDIACLISEAH